MAGKTRGDVAGAVSRAEGGQSAQRTHPTLAWKRRDAAARAAVAVVVPAGAQIGGKGRCCGCGGRSAKWAAARAHRERARGARSFAASPVAGARRKLRRTSVSGRPQSPPYVVAFHRALTLGDHEHLAGGNGGGKGGGKRAGIRGRARCCVVTSWLFSSRAVSCMSLHARVDQSQSMRIKHEASLVPPIAAIVR